MYLPSKTVSSQQIINECTNSVNIPLARLVGIHSRRMVAEGEYSLELATHAISQCFSFSKYTPSDIDLLICCNISRMQKGNQFGFEPSTAHHLSSIFGMENAIGFDVSNACAGVFTGIQIADAYLRSNLAKRVLVVSGEYITHLTETAQKEIEGLQDSRLACLTLGDSGTAVLLESGIDPSEGFQAIDLFTLGDYSDYCIGIPTTREHGGCLMYTQSVKLAQVAIKGGSASIRSVLEKHCWNPFSIDHLIPHQTSHSSIKLGLRNLNHIFEEPIFYEEKNVIVNLGDKGNTSTNSHIIAFYENMKNGRIKKGDKVVFSINASGLTLGTSLFIVNDLPKKIQGTYLNGKTKTFSYHNNIFPSEHTDFQRVKITSIGLAPSHASTKNQTLEYAKTATNNCFEKTQFNQQDLDLLIFAGIYRNDFICEPAIAAMIAGDLGINSDLKFRKKDTFAFDIANGAVGFLNACQVVHSMFRSGYASTALVVTSEVENNADHLPYPLLDIEETGAAILLQPSNDHTGFGSFYFKKFPQWINEYRTCLEWNELGQTYLGIQRSNELESLYLKAIDETVKEMLEKEGKTLSDFALILPPQISTDFIERVKKTLRSPALPFINITDGKKNLFTAAAFYAFDHVFNNNLAKEGDKALVINVGSGIQVGCAIYYF